MSLFDAIREKAGELLSGATEKIGDVAGDLPGVQDLSQSATDVAGQAGDVAGRTGEHVTGAAQDLGATATDTATDTADSVTGALPEPYRP